MAWWHKEKRIALSALQQCRRAKPSILPGLSRSWQVTRTGKFPLFVLVQIHIRPQLLLRLLHSMMLPLLATSTMHWTQLWNPNPSKVTRRSIVPCVVFRSLRTKADSDTCGLPNAARSSVWTNSSFHVKCARNLSPETTLANGTSERCTLAYLDSRHKDRKPGAMPCRRVDLQGRPPR